MDDRLREIEERAAKASPGPWYPRATDDGMFMNASYVSTKPDPDGLFIHDGDRGMAPGECDDASVVAITLLQSPRLAGVADEKWDENTEFIAHSREDIPWLIQQLRQLQGQIDRLTLDLEVERQAREVAELQAHGLKTKLTVLRAVSLDNVKGAMQEAMDAALKQATTP